MIIIIFWNIFSINLFTSQSTTINTVDAVTSMVFFFCFSEIFSFTWCGNVENVEQKINVAVLLLLLNSWKVRWWFIWIFLFFLCLSWIWNGNTYHYSWTISFRWFSFQWLCQLQKRKSLFFSFSLSFSLKMSLLLFCTICCGLRRFITNHFVI